MLHLVGFFFVCFLKIEGTLKIEFIYLFGCAGSSLRPRYSSCGARASHCSVENLSPLAEECGPQSTLASVVVAPGFTELQGR